MEPITVDLFALASAMVKVTKDSPSTDSEIYKNVVTYYDDFCKLNSEGTNDGKYAKCEAFERPF